jgi:integral membrane protein
MSPLILFRRVAVAEAVTWALLLVGMFLEHVTVTTDLGVRVFGMLHGVVFVAYCVATVVVAVDQRWRPGRVLLGLVSAVPPFMTLWFEGYAERRGGLDTTWRLREQDGADALERATATLVRKPLLGLGVAIAAVAALTGVALLVGPPTS